MSSVTSPKAAPWSRSINTIQGRYLLRPDKRGRVNERARLKVAAGRTPRAR